MALPTGVSKDSLRAIYENTAGPDSVSRIPSAAGSVNATLAKASAGAVFNISGYNAAAAVRYLKLYNKATAPTVGTDTPFVTLALPATAAFNIDLHGLKFSTGIGYGTTTAAADNSTAAVTAADIVGLSVTYA